MASRRKLPLVLFLITLVLLAGAVVLLLRGRPVTLERIAARQGYAITGQEEATVTLTLSREQMPEGFPEEVPISQAEGELQLSIQSKPKPQAIPLNTIRLPIPSSLQAWTETIPPMSLLLLSKTEAP